VPVSPLRGFFFFGKISDFLSILTFFSPYILRRKMTDTILTLQYPQGLKGLPIATTTNILALRFFKRTVLQDWETKIQKAVDEGEAMLYRLEYQRLKSALDIFIPEEEDDEK
jgi:hypothetical protein